MPLGRLRTSLRRRLKTASYRYTVFTNHFSDLIRYGGNIVDTCSVVGAVMCLVCLVVMVGYDHTAADLQRLRLLLRAVHITFIVQAAYNLVLRQRMLRRAGVLRRIVEIAILLTVLPLAYPHPAHPWFPLLEHVLYSHRFIYTAMSVYAVVEISFAISLLTSRRTNPSLLLSASFLFFIIAGSFVLMLPKCTYVPISYVDSLFLATSTVCITGLTPVDIATTFTPIGLAVLAVLIQIGGIGVLTFTSFFALFFSGTTSVYNQLLIRDMMYSRTMNALIPTLLYIIGFTLTVEAMGAVAVYFTIPDELELPQTQKLIFAAFHSLSAFCNAGFSCLPDGMANPALMTPGQALINVTSVLIFAGAIGFPILVNFKDIVTQKLRNLWARIRNTATDAPVHLTALNSKLVLTTSLIILVVGTVAFFVLEYNNTLAGMTLWQKISQSVFNSLIPRSAGFQSVNPAMFMPLTLMLIVIQMWIGGSSQSLAGGIKVNTVATVFLNVRSVLRGATRPWAYQRSLSVGSVRRANSVLILAIVAYLVFSGILMLLEPKMALKPLLFEVTSALFTVGSSLGATSVVSDPSKITLCVAMFVGRVGILSILAGFFSHRNDPSVHFPEESVIIN